MLLIQYCTSKKSYNRDLFVLWSFDQYKILFQISRDVMMTKDLLQAISRVHVKKCILFCYDFSKFFLYPQLKSLFCNFTVLLRNWSHEIHSYASYTNSMAGILYPAVRKCQHHKAVLNQGKWAFLLKYQLESSKCRPEMKPQNISELHSQRNTVTLASRRHKMYFPYYKTTFWNSPCEKVAWQLSF